MTGDPGRRFAAMTAATPRRGLPAKATPDALSAARRFNETKGRRREVATPARSQHAPAPHEGPDATATKARRGTHAKSKPVAAPSQHEAVDAARPLAPVEGHPSGQARPAAKDPERSSAASVPGRVAPDGRRPGLAARGARATATIVRLAGRRIVVAGQVVRLAAVAAALPRATRRDELVAGRDL